MKKVSIFLLTLVCALIFAGCSCDHEWKEADCVNPKTCTLCGKVEGEVLGHDWVEATCTTVKTCSRCGRTSGDPLGHSWTEATCTEPKTCTVCGTQVGSPLGHTWVEATTEAPKTCTVCNATEGERIVTDPRFLTADAAPFFGRWECAVDYSEEELDVTHYNGTLTGTYWIEFGSAGELQAGFALEDEEAFRAAMAEYCADLIFDEVAEHRADEEEANATAQALLGMDVETYIRSTQKETPVDELIEQLLAESELRSGWAGTFVYYVKDGRLYRDTEWNEEMPSVSCELIGTTLLLDHTMELKAADAA